MFVITELNDKIEIKASETDKELAVINAAKTKYLNRLVNDLGLCVHFYELIDISEFAIKSNVLVADVTFQCIFLRFYAEEICTGRILKQEEDKIIVSNELFDNFEVQSVDLFENSEFCYENSKWIWNYKSNKLFLNNGDNVKFKIKKLRYEDVTVEVFMNEPGLGPAVWWD